MIQTIRSFFFPTTASLVASLTRTVNRLDKLAEARKQKATAAREAADQALDAAYVVYNRAYTEAKAHSDESRTAAHQADKLRALLA